MTRTTSHPTSPTRRRRPRRGLAGDGLDALAREEDAARQLAADLSALVHAGLVAPASDGDELRFAAVEPDDKAA
jgi:hypothetical protein